MSRSVFPPKIKIRRDCPDYVRDFGDYEAGHPTLGDDIDAALQEVLAAFAANPKDPHGGAGDRIQRVNRPCWKKRAQDSCCRIGKRGAWRIIYMWIPEQHTIALLHLFHKSRMADIAGRAVLAAAGNLPNPPKG
jgi:hypothetical protein